MPWNFPGKQLFYMQIGTVLLHFQWCAFYFFSCLISLARTFSTLLDKSGEGSHPRLVPAIGGTYSVLHHHVQCQLQVILQMLIIGEVLLYFFFSFLFLLISVELSNAFSASVDIIMSFFSFSLLIRCIALTDFQIRSHPCIHGLNLAGWCIGFLLCIAEFYL